MLNTTALGVLDDVLMDIEDKLRERGMLVSLSGDPEAESTLEFKSDDEAQIFITLVVDALGAQSLDFFVAEQIAFYISSKMHEAFQQHVFGFEEYSVFINIYVNGAAVFKLD